jgi:hypothetical protein
MMMPLLCVAPTLGSGLNADIYPEDVPQLAAPLTQAFLNDPNGEY